MRCDICIQYIITVQLHYVQWLCVFEQERDRACVWVQVCENAVLSVMTRLIMSNFVLVVPPVIQLASSQIVASVGDRTVLPCVTTGNPLPTITWSFDRRPIDPRNSRYTVMEDGSLVINSVQVSCPSNFLLLCHTWYCPSLLPLVLSLSVTPLCYFSVGATHFVVSPSAAFWCYSSDGGGH